MTNAEAYKRAKAALDKADEAQGKAHVEHGEGWGAMDSAEIYSHILSFLAAEFRQAVK